MTSTANKMATTTQSFKLYEELKLYGWAPQTPEEFHPIYLQLLEKGIISENKKTKKQKKKEPTQRCMARVWGNKDDPNVGTGICQCTKSKNGDSDYCTQHAAQAAICVPINGYACQNPWGLDHGRIDEHIPVADKEGRIIKLWTKGDIAKEIADKKASGEYQNDGFDKFWSKTRKEMKIRKIADYTEEKYEEFRRKIDEFTPTEQKSRGRKKQPKQEDDSHSQTSDSNTETSEAVRELQEELETHEQSQAINVQVDDHDDSVQDIFTDKSEEWHSFSYKGENYFVEEDTWLIFKQGTETEDDPDGAQPQGKWIQPCQIYTKESFIVTDIKWHDDDSDEDSDDEMV